MDCLFCAIVAGDIPSAKVYEDEFALAFLDIEPKAPVHALIVPKKHVDDILECDAETAAALLNAVKQVARVTGVDKSGFRVISNCGDDSRRTVKHLHVHVLGGRQLSVDMA